MLDDLPVADGTGAVRFCAEAAGEELLHFFQTAANISSTRTLIRAWRSGTGEAEKSEDGGWRDGRMDSTQHAAPRMACQ